MEVALEVPIKKAVLIGSHKQQIMYEGLDTFCSSCRVIGHNTSNCEKEKIGEQASKSEDPNQASPKQDKGKNKVSTTKADEEQWSTVSFRGSKSKKGQASNQKPRYK